MRSKFLLAAISAVAGFSSLAHADGDLDTTFYGGAGTRILQMDVDGPGPDSASKVLIDKKNRIYMIGTSYEKDSPYHGHFALTRLGGLGDTAGQGDLGFGFWGGTQTPPETGNIIATSATFANNGNIVVAGYTIISATNYDFFACSFSPNGVLANCVRPVFDVGLWGNNVDMAKDVLVDDQNRVLMVGTSQCQTQSICGSLVRLLSNGAPDNSFGSSGYVNLEYLPQGGGFSYQINAVTIDNQGRILVAGSLINTVLDEHPKVLIERLLPNGQRDLSWHNNLQTYSLDSAVPGSDMALATDIVFDERENSVLVGGKVLTNPNSGVWAGFVMKLDATGKPVTNFSNDGLALLNSAGSSTVESLARTHDGNYVLGGTALSTSDFLLQKINYYTGQYVTQYGASGRRLVDVGDSSYADVGWSIAVSPYYDFSVLVGNTTVGTGSSKNVGFSIARLDSDVIFYHSLED